MFIQQLADSLLELMDPSPTARGLDDFEGREGQDYRVVT